MIDCIWPCDLKNSDYECLFFKNPDGCMGICVRNGELCEYCKLKELSNSEVEEENDRLRIYTDNARSWI